MKKKTLAMLLAFLLCMTTVTAPAAADTDNIDTGKNFTFGMTVNGAASTEVALNETVHLKVTLQQENHTGAMTMYAVTDRILYNHTMLSLSADSIKSGEITVTQRNLGSGMEDWSELIFSTWSTDAEGTSWENPKTLLEADFTAIKTGTATFQQKDAEMSVTNGMKKYSSTAESASVLISAKNGGQTTGGGGGGSAGTSAGTSVETPVETVKTTTPVESVSVTQPTGITETTMLGSSTFTDVAAGSWYDEAVGYAVKKGMFSGIDATHFAPETTMSRGMLVTVLYRMSGSPMTGKEVTFTDVTADAWYASGVAWAKANGIVNGFADGSFAPDQPVTREQFAAILKGYASLKGMDTAVTGNMDAFADQGSVSAWAADALRWAIGNGILSGTDAQHLTPAGTATRAQAAQMLMRFDKK